MKDLCGKLVSKYIFPLKCPQDSKFSCISIFMNSLTTPQFLDPAWDPSPLQLPWSCYLLPVYLPSCLSYMDNRALLKIFDFSPSLSYRQFQTCIFITPLKTQWCSCWVLMAPCWSFSKLVHCYLEFCVCVCTSKLYSISYAFFPGSAES